MNENQKTIISLILSFLLGVAITLAITIPIHISSTRQNNIRAGELSVRLSETSRGLAEAESTIASLRESSLRISEAANRSNETLTGVIESLRQIRDEVQIMEERLYSLDNNSGNHDSDNSGSVMLSE